MEQTSIGRAAALAPLILSVTLAAGHCDARAETRETDRTQLPAAPSAVVRPLVLPSGVEVAREQPGTIALTLDQAIATALTGNTQLKVSVLQERFIRGEVLTVGNALLPNLKASAYTRAQEINLAAMGFKPGSVNIPGFSGTFPTIVKVNTTNAQLSLSQALFNVPAYFLYRSAQKAVEAGNWATLSARGGVALNTGTLYLRVLADEAQVANAEALVQQDEVVYEHARAAQEAGVGIHIDVLRGQVQLQQERQVLVQARNAVDKDKIQLNRIMGQPAGQAIDLVDKAPFAELDELTLAQALEVAYVKRKDLRGLEAQLEVAQRAQQAVRYERLPTVAFGGFYGVLGETTGLYHGVFTAQGQVSVPVFEEATLRGQKVVAAAQVAGLTQQIASRRASIEADIRSSMLDVESSRKLVEVARGNVQLASQALSDATLRFTSGVDDNLPVVQAQAAFAQAQTQVIQAEFQYNTSKLQLARNTGVVETQYRQYLGR